MSKKNQNLNVNDPTLKDGSDAKKKMQIFFNDKFMPAMSKIASQKHLTTIRDSFGLLTPVIIGGSIALLLGILIFGAGNNLDTSLLGLLSKAFNGTNNTTDPITGVVTWELLGGWKIANQVGEKIFQTIFDFSMGIFALMISFVMGYVYAQRIGIKNTLLASVLNLVCFMILSATFGGGKYNYFFDSKGMLMAILATFLVMELFRIISKNKRILIKMPKQVPPMVADSFSVLIPVALVLITVSTINTGAWAIGNWTHWDILGSKIVDGVHSVDLKGGQYGMAGLFFNAIASPITAALSGASAGLGFGISYQFLIGFFWFFGLNGSSVVNGAYYPFLLQMLLNNATMVAKEGYDAVANSLNVISIQSIESYSQITGWGHTGALLLAIGIFGNVQEHKSIAKLSATPALFQINEPVTFGLPVMLHPVYGVAAMFAMPLTLLFAWVFIGPLGLVRKSYIMVPWTMPPGLGALLSTGFDWKAFILAWGCLVIAFVWYIPFVLIANKYHFNLNVQSYVGQGLSRTEAVVKVKSDYEQSQQEVLESKRIKKEQKVNLKKAKSDIKLLSPEEQKTYYHKSKMLKQEKKTADKLEELNNSNSNKKVDSVKITVVSVEYGGFKIKVDNRTFAAVIDPNVMNQAANKIAKANNASYYTIIDDKGEQKIDVI